MAEAEPRGRGRGARGGGRARARGRPGARLGRCSRARARGRVDRRSRRLPPATTSPTKPRSLPRPIAVAITGGIGAGKSEALYAFQQGRRRDRLERRDRPPPAGRGRRCTRRDGGASWGRASSPRTATIDRTRVADVVFADRAKLDFLEALLHPRVAAEYLRWREQLARAAEPAARLRDRGAAPLRVGRRGALRQGRRDHGAREAARRSAAACAATTATAVSCPTRRRSSGPTSPTSTPAR